jgi:catechol 2,3-dioxygenase-like lactoylglutathione lyase family enzyme
MDMKLEVVVIPVSDVDRSKQFYKALGWRLDADVVTDEAATTFSSVDDLAAALRRAAAAHGEHEVRIGCEDPDWPAWYARYLVREQAGIELPA